MKFPRPIICISALSAALITSLTVPAGAQTSSRVKHARAVRGLQRDLQAIPSGSQPTDAQKQALAADLNRLLRKTGPLPTVTVDFLAEKLAAAASQGRFAAGDIRAIAVKLTALATGSLYYNNVRTADLSALLTKAGLAAADVQQITDAVRALPNSFESNNDFNVVYTDLQAISPATKGYRQATGTIQQAEIQSAQAVKGVVTDPINVSHTLTVSISQVPIGKYRVSVTTIANEQPVEIGTLRVRVSPPLLVPAALSLAAMEAPAATDDPSTDPADTGVDDGSDDSGVDPNDGDLASQNGSSGVITTAVPGGVVIPGPGGTFRYATAVFGDASYAKPLPAGVSATDVTGVTITDDQGVRQLAGSLVNASDLRTSRTVRFHLVAGSIAPTAGGTVSFGVNDGNFHGKTFLSQATGLPANATLTLNVDGTAVTPVTTGPTGNLYVRSSQAVFPRPPRSTEVVNLLPDTVNLYTVKSLTLSDAAGNVLLSGGLVE